MKRNKLMFTESVHRRADPCNIILVPAPQQGDDVQAWGNRTDGKLYRLQTPQKPLARTEQYDAYNMDDYPQVRQRHDVGMGHAGMVWAT